MATEQEPKRPISDTQAFVTERYAEAYVGETPVTDDAEFESGQATRPYITYADGSRFWVDLEQFDVSRTRNKHPRSEQRELVPLFLSPLSAKPTEEGPHIPLPYARPNAAISSVLGDQTAQDMAKDYGVSHTLIGQLRDIHFKDLHSTASPELQAKHPFKTMQLRRERHSLAPVSRSGEVRSTPAILRLHQEGHSRDELNAQFGTSSVRSAIKTLAKKGIDGPELVDRNVLEKAAERMRNPETPIEQLRSDIALFKANESIRAYSKGSDPLLTPLSFLQKIVLENSNFRLTKQLYEVLNQAMLPVHFITLPITSPTGKVYQVNRYITITRLRETYLEVLFAWKNQT